MSLLALEWEPFFYYCIKITKFGLRYLAWSTNDVCMCVYVCYLQVILWILNYSDEQSLYHGLTFGAILWEVFKVCICISTCAGYFFDFFLGVGGGGGGGGKGVLCVCVCDL